MIAAHWSHSWSGWCVFCTGRYTGANRDSRTKLIPNTWDALIETLSLTDARPVATPVTRDTGEGQANSLCELRETERAIYMFGSRLLQ